ncbi:MAG: siroheme synthase CysG [Pseudomonadota bacterium]
MKSFPMFIRTTGRKVVIVGGGEQAAQKARLILKTDARIVLAAPELDPELQALVDEGKAEWHPATPSSSVFEGAAMGFIATGCPGLDACLHGVAGLARCPVNVVDRPDLCDLTTPSLVDRDPVVVAIGTEGTAPVLARHIKTRVEEMLAPNLGGLAALAGRLRTSVAAQIPRNKRRAFWRWVFADAPRQSWVRGAEREAASQIKNAIAQRQAPDTSTNGSISLVGAGPGARDLLTLRAVERLQEADVIFYDRLMGEDVLELARRDAERIYVGKSVGASAWPQERINALIVGEAKKGRRVVRLKAGDPGIFGRATEELEAAKAAGIPVEIVPGITAACAASANASRSLTERGATDTLVMATGRCRDGAPLPDCVRFATPGTALAFYMSVGQAERIQTALLARGMAANTPVTVGVDVSKTEERMLETPLGGLAEMIRAEGVTGCAVILISWSAGAGAGVQPQPAAALVA